MAESNVKVILECHQNGGILPGDCVGKTESESRREEVKAGSGEDTQGEAQAHEAQREVGDSLLRGLCIGVLCFLNVIAMWTIGHGARSQPEYTERTPVGMSSSVLIREEAPQYRTAVRGSYLRNFNFVQGLRVILERAFSGGSARGYYRIASDLVGPLAAFDWPDAVDVLHICSELSSLARMNIERWGSAVVRYGKGPQGGLIGREFWRVHSGPDIGGMIRYEVVGGLLDGFSGKASLPKGEQGVDEDEADGYPLKRVAAIVSGCILFALGVVLLFKTWTPVNFYWPSKIHEITLWLRIFASACLIWAGLGLFLFTLPA